MGSCGRRTMRARNTGRLACRPVLKRCLGGSTPGAGSPKWPLRHSTISFSPPAVRGRERLRAFLEPKGPEDARQFIFGGQDA